MCGLVTHMASCVLPDARHTAVLCGFSAYVMPGMCTRNGDVLALVSSHDISVAVPFRDAPPPRALYGMEGVSLHDELAVRFYTVGHAACPSDWDMTELQCDPHYMSSRVVPSFYAGGPRKQGPPVVVLRKDDVVEDERTFARFQDVLVQRGGRRNRAYGCRLQHQRNKLVAMSAAGLQRLSEQALECVDGLRMRAWLDASVAAVQD
jgi:hypothetical protein